MVTLNSLAEISKRTRSPRNPTKYIFGQRKDTDMLKNFKTLLHY